MGRKSRLKKERKALKATQPQFFLKKAPAITPNKIDTNFEKFIQDLQDLFYQYSAVDVCNSLNVSALWLPNISTPLRLFLATWVFASSITERFKTDCQIITYEDFERFSNALNRQLLQINFHEDFIPEMDWGDVRVESNKQYLNIFYGGAVENLYDFIQAYKLFFQGTDIKILKGAAADLHSVLLIQNYIISNIDKSLFPTEINIRPGHLEIPSKDFWEILNPLLNDFPNALDGFEISSDLVIEQGGHELPRSNNTFMEAYFHGSALQQVVIKIGDQKYPINIRGAVGVLLNFWSSKVELLPRYNSDKLPLNFNNFLSQRFKTGKFITGPSVVSIKSRKFDAIIFATLICNEKLYLLVLAEPDSNNSFLELRQAFAESAKVHPSEIQFVIHTHYDGGILLNGKPDNVEFILVNPNFSANQTLAFRDEEWEKFRFIYLTELLAILDSLDNIEEFRSYWDYYDEHIDSLGPIAGALDIFASFRDTDKVLNEGADEPDLIILDPHWGSNWRFNELKLFWQYAPKVFPEYGNISWKLEESQKHTQIFESKSKPIFVSHSQVNSCSLFFQVEVSPETLEYINAHILETASQCIADCTSTRSKLIQSHPIFSNRRIVVELLPNRDFLASETYDPSVEDSKHPLFSSWEVNELDDLHIKVTVSLNILVTQYHLIHVVDSSFEVKILTEWLIGMSHLLNLNMDESIIHSINETKSNTPRFYLAFGERTIDVPEFGFAHVPTNTDYKLARKELAKLLKELGIQPGKYELNNAKPIIDQAKNGFRKLIHSQISNFDRISLVLSCVEQIDTLMANYQREADRLRLSLKHEVDYERADHSADLHREFIKCTTNYRYLLEFTYSADASGDIAVAGKDLRSLIASIDWLFVLNGLSDTLYNGIDVGGVLINDQFIPEIYYSERRDISDQEFEREVARNRLGVELNSSDEVSTKDTIENRWQKLDDAFLQDTGFKFSSLTYCYMVLSKWASFNEDIDPKYLYSSSASELTQKIVKVFPEVSIDEAEKVVSFLILDPERIRCLEGRDEPELDVPVWEYNKRTTRFMLRPLIKFNDILYWGPSSTRRALNIWRSQLLNGYLPADFPWSNLKSLIRDFKESIEKHLEVKSHEICARYTPYALRGIDFRRRFAKERFPDVGDYDVLAYWPDINLWLSFEAKYNQPPYCLKDARRLQERIFGREKDRGQFSKIEGRRAFLNANLEKLRFLLDWPRPKEDKPLRTHDIYVSRDVYWVMRNSPYPVPTSFVRVDALDKWIENYLADFE